MASMKVPEFKTLIPCQNYAWGKLFHAAASSSAHPDAAAVVFALDWALDSLKQWSGLMMSSPFDVWVNPSQVFPVAWPQLQPPLIVLPPSTGPTAFTRADLVHELAHLLLYVPRSRLLSEGWAVAAGYTLATDTRFPFNARTPDALHARVLEPLQPVWSLRDYLQGGRLYDDLLVREAPSEAHRLAYGRAGSFVLHLIAQEGVERLVRVMQALAGNDLLQEEAALAQGYGRSLADLEEEWRQSYLGAPRLLPSQLAVADRGPERVPLTGAWTLMTDQAIRGNSTGTLQQEQGLLSISGQMGTRGTYQFVSAQQHLREDGTYVDVSALQRLRFETRGDGKNYQLWLATAEASQPGKEFLYFFSAPEQWTRVEVPFTHLQCFASDNVPWTGRKVLSLGFRAFGYRSQSIHFSIRGLEFST
jgi:hypothetical protein